MHPPSASWHRTRSTSGSQATNPANGREIARRWLMSFCLIFLFVIFAAGPLRKWVTPELHQYLALLHLPVLATIYLHCLLFRFWPKMTVLLALTIVMAVAVIGIAIAQVVGEEAIVIPALAGFAWIGYFAFIPLALIIRDHFTQKDIEKVAIMLLLVMIANTVIMALQSNFLASDAINQGFGEDQDEIFLGLGLIDDLTRPMGIFTSPLANSVFIVFSVGLIWMFFVTPRQVSLRGWFFWPALATGGFSLILAGSRYAVLSFAVMVALTIITIITSRHAAGRMRGLIHTLLPLAIIGSLSIVLLGNSGGALKQRFEVAWEQEEEVYSAGTLSRMFLQTDIKEVLDNLEDTPFLGYGLGTGSNAAYILGEIPVELYREATWAKHLNDLGPLFALIYIALRLAFVLSALRHSIVDWRSLGDPSALVLLSQIGVQVATGQTVSHVVVGPLAWVFFGLLLAWLRQSREGATTPGPS